MSPTWRFQVSARQVCSAQEYEKSIYLLLLGSTILLCLTTMIVHKMFDFLVVEVDFLGRARVLLKINSVIIVTFFSCASSSEIVLPVCNWVFYSFIAGFTTLLIAFHQDFHPDSTPTEVSLSGRAMENTNKVPNTAIKERGKKCVCWVTWMW